MTVIKRAMWPGILIALVGASVAVHIIMFIVIHANPAMTQDMRKIETPSPSPIVGESQQKADNDD